MVVDTNAIGVDADMEQRRSAVIAELRAGALAGGFPGPDVDEHDEGYDGPCYCRLCLSYMD